MLRQLLDVFAVEDSSVQLSWASLPAAELTLEIGEQLVPLIAEPPAWSHRRGRPPKRLSPRPGGPGTITVAGLEPGTTYEVLAAGAGLTRRVVATFRTLTPPPGPLLCRFATISDLHLGERSFGLFTRFEDNAGDDADLEPYALRAARAAIDEALLWGIDLLVVKGDVTHNSRPWQFRQAGELFRQAGVPVEALLGNHDVRKGIDGPGLLGEYDIPCGRAPRVHDMPGARVVIGHTPHPRHHAGEMDRDLADELAALAGGTEAPAIIICHHPPDRLPVPTAYPPGIHWNQSNYLLRALQAANPNSVFLGGHTHRNRRYDVHGVPVAEVGSTKDYPGCWAGYAVHEGGIRQVVRRVAAPNVVAWTQSTARVLAGIWGRWSPGQLDDRCWTHQWKPAR